MKVKSLSTPYLYYMTSKVTSLCSLENYSFSLLFLLEFNNFSATVALKNPTKNAATAIAVILPLPPFF